MAKLVSEIRSHRPGIAGHLPPERRRGALPALRERVLVPRQRLPGHPDRPPARRPPLGRRSRRCASSSTSPGAWPTAGCWSSAPTATSSCPAATPWPRRWPSCAGTRASSGSCSGGCRSRRSRTSSRGSPNGRWNPPSSRWWRPSTGRRKATPTSSRRWSATCSRPVGPSGRAAAGGWTSARCESLAIPEGIRELIARRLSRLSEAGIDVLTRAAVLGAQFDFAVLEHMTGLDEDALLAALEEALDAQLIEQADTATGPRPLPLRPRRHPPEPLRGPEPAPPPAAPPPGRRSDRGGPGGATSAPTSRPWPCTTGRPGAAADPARAVEYSVKAGEVAQGVFAYEDAARTGRRRSTCWARPAGDAVDRAVHPGPPRRPPLRVRASTTTAAPPAWNRPCASTRTGDARPGGADALPVGSQPGQLPRAHGHPPGPRSLPGGRGDPCRNRPRAAPSATSCSGRPARRYGVSGRMRGWRPRSGRWPSPAGSGNERLRRHAATHQGYHLASARPAGRGLRRVRPELGGDRRRPGRDGRLLLDLGERGSSRSICEIPPRRGPAASGSSTPRATARRRSESVPCWTSWAGPPPSAETWPPPARPATKSGTAGTPLPTSPSTKAVWTKRQRCGKRCATSRNEPGTAATSWRARWGSRSSAVCRTEWTTPSASCSTRWPSPSTGRSASSSSPRAPSWPSSWPMAAAPPKPGVIWAGHSNWPEPPQDWRGLGGRVLLAEAVVLWAEGKNDAADLRAMAAVEVFRRIGLPWDEADAQRRLGQSRLRARDRTGAVQRFAAALELYRRHGAGGAWIEPAGGRQARCPGRGLLRGDGVRPYRRRRGARRAARPGAHDVAGGDGHPSLLRHRGFHRRQRPPR